MMTLKLEVVDPGTLTAVADISDMLIYDPSDSITWGLDDETALSGTIHYLAGRSWDSEIVRLSRVDEESVTVLGTAYAIPGSHEMIGSLHAGSISLMGTPLALRSTLISAPYLVSAAPIDTVLTQACDIAGLRYDADPDMSESAVSELQIFEAGTSCLSIAQAAADRVGGHVSQTPSGEIVVRVPRLVGPQESWTNRSGSADITSEISKSSTRYDTPTRLIAAYTGAGDNAEFMSTIIELESSYDSTRHRDVMLSVSDLESPSREQLLARAERYVEDSLSPVLTDEWSFDSVWKNISVGETVTVEDADNSETLTGYVTSMSISLAPGTPMTVTVRGVVS